MHATTQHERVPPVHLGSGYQLPHHPALAEAKVSGGGLEGGWGGVGGGSIRMDSGSGLGMLFTDLGLDNFLSRDADFDLVAA